MVETLDRSDCKVVNPQLTQLPLCRIASSCAFLSQLTVDRKSLKTKCLYGLFMRANFSLMSFALLASCGQVEESPPEGDSPSSHSGILETEALETEIGKAESGNSESMRSVAIHYEAMGPDHSSLALNWMERAAKNGNFLAQRDVLSSYLARGMCEKAKSLFEEMKESGELDDKHYGYASQSWRLCVDLEQRKAAANMLQATP